MKLPNLKKITEPSWEHKAGYGINSKKEWYKQKIQEQATTPEDKNILEKLEIKKGEKILAVAGYYASWASALKKAGTKVDYSDISKSLVNWVKKNCRIKFEKYLCSNYELIPKKENDYDWTFTFEACGGGQGLPVAYLRSLLNKKGGILILFLNRKKKEVMGSKPKRYPAIVNKLSKIYRGKSKIKKINFEGHRKGQEFSKKIPHKIYWIFTNDKARTKVKLDLKILEYIKNKKQINLERDSKFLKIDKKDLKKSLGRLNKFSKLIKKDFLKEIKIK